MRDKQKVEVVHKDSDAERTAGWAAYFGRDALVRKAVEKLKVSPYVQGFRKRTLTT